VQEFAVTESAGTNDDTAMGDTDETHLVGIKSWNGTLKCSSDASDAAQQALAVSASIALELYPESAGSGQEKLTGTATITEVTRNVNRSNVVERNLNFKGNGALTHGTV